MKRYAGLVLAAGMGSRFLASGGLGPTKLVAQLGGVPVVRHVVAAALASSVDPVVVVTGHAVRAVEEALKGFSVAYARNADYAAGLATSLRTGIAAIPSDAAGAVILLGDMPLITPGLIDRLIRAASLDPALDAVIPSVDGRWGNPVVLARSLFTVVSHLEGDAGARHLLRTPGVRVQAIEIEDASVTLDIDQASDLAGVRSHGRSG